ncbi:MAG: alpha/beta fold hydrolase [Desulfobaccales bacterium]
MRPIKILLIGFLLILILTGCAHVPAPTVSLEQSLGQQKTFDYQGVKINYYEAGQGPPIILLHGFGGCSYSWRFLAPELAQDHRVFTVDLKGYGLSDKPEDGNYAVSNQADMVAAFIRSQDLHDVVIMGHSMGGGVTLMTYLKVREDQPARVKSLVLIDSAGYPQKMPWFIWLAKAPGVGAVAGKLVSPRFASYMVLRKCYYYDDKITEDQIDTYAYYGSLPGAREAVVQTAKQIVPADIDALIAQYKTISVPVLVIWGEEDEVVPLTVGKNFKRDIPNSELVILPKCGHMPPEEEPGGTTRIIKTFLEK